MGHRAGLPADQALGRRAAARRDRAGAARHRPTLLLCDEPTGNLDSVNTESVLALFHELGDDGLTLVVITHDEDVAAHASREVRIVDGHLTEVTR